MDIESAQVQLIDDFANKLGLVESKAAPVKLYHYTANSVLHRIVKNRCFWMSHILDMNDSTEFSHGMKKFRDALDSPKLAEVDSGWLSRMKEFFDEEMKNPLASPFVISLTEESDQLSQWRAYGDGSRGVSIGIKTNQLIDITGQPLLLNVIYDSTIQDRIVNEVLGGFIALILSMDPTVLNDGTTWGPRLAFGYFRASYLQSVRFKDHPWHEESEWRSVVIAGAKDQNRFCIENESRRRLSLQIPDLRALFSDIVIGPLADKSTQRSALSELCVNNDFELNLLESQISMKE